MYTYQGDVQLLCYVTVEYRDEQKEMEMKARWRPLVKQEVKEEPPPSPSQDYKPNIDSHHGNRKSHRHDSDSDPSLERNKKILE